MLTYHHDTIDYQKGWTPSGETVGRFVNRVELPKAVESWEEEEEDVRLMSILDSEQMDVAIAERLFEPRKIIIFNKASPEILIVS